MKNQSNRKLNNQQPQPSQYKHISEQQLKQIKASFDLFDTDQGGFIDSKQLKQAMISLGFESRNNSIFNMICDLDSDGNGVISFDQWVGLMTTQATDNQSREHYNKIFRLFDNQNSGYICAHRLQQVAKQIGQSIQQTEIIQMLKRADKDIDGLISEQEFYYIVTKKVNFCPNWS